MKEENYQGPGLYRHYKGGLYKVLGLGAHTQASKRQPGFDADDPNHCWVVYSPMSQSILTNTMTSFWLRKLSNFNEDVEYLGETVKRFEFVSPAE